MNSFNMKRFVLFLIIVMFVSFGLGVGITLFSNKGNFVDSKASMDVNIEKSTPIDSVKNISVTSTSTKINLITEKRTDIKAILKGSITTSSKSPKPDLIIDKTSDSIKIKVNEPNIHFGFYFSNVNLDIYIPESFTNTLELKSVSGHIKINGNITLDNFSCETTSASIEANNVNCNTFSLSSVSGKLNCGTINSKTSELHSTSGSISIDSLVGDLEGKTVSGEINVKYTQFNNKIDLRSTSGKVNLSLPDKAEFYIYAKSTSGNIDCDFPVTITEKQGNHTLKGTVISDKNNITISTVSGSIDISK